MEVANSILVNVAIGIQDFMAHGGVFLTYGAGLAYKINAFDGKLRALRLGYYRTPVTDYATHQFLLGVEIGLGDL